MMVTNDNDGNDDNDDGEMMLMMMYSDVEWWQWLGDDG